jgi:hypothetical protein
MNQRIFNRPRRKRVFFFFQWEKKNKKRQKPQMTFFVLLLSIVLVMVARVDSVWKFHSLRVAPLRDCINGRIGDRPRFTIFASAAAGASTSGQVLMNNGTNVAMVDFFEPLAIEFVLSDTEGTSKIEKSMSATVQMWGTITNIQIPSPLISKTVGANNLLIGQTCNGPTPHFTPRGVDARDALSNRTVQVNMMFNITLKDVATPAPPPNKRQVSANAPFAIMVQVELQRPFLDSDAISPKPLPQADTFPHFRDFVAAHQPRSCAMANQRVVLFRRAIDIGNGNGELKSLVCRDLNCVAEDAFITDAPLRGPLILLPDTAGTGWTIGLAGPEHFWTKSIGCAGEQLARSVQIPYGFNLSNDKPISLVRCEVEGGYTRTIVAHTHCLRPDLSQWEAFKFQPEMSWAKPYIFPNNARMPLGVRASDGNLIWGNTDTSVNMTDSLPWGQYADGLVFDVDLDGVMDLLLFGPALPSRVFKGSLLGNFSLYHTFDVNFVSAFAIDINGDGLLDLMTSHSFMDKGLIFLNRDGTFFDLPRAATVFQMPEPRNSPTFVANLRDPFVYDWVGLETRSSWVVFGNTLGQARFVRLRLADTTKFARINVTIPDRNDTLFTHVVFDPTNQNDDTMLIALPWQWRVDITIQLLPGSAQPIKLCGVSPYSMTEPDRQAIIMAGMTAPSALESIVMVTVPSAPFNLSSVIQFNAANFRASDRLLLYINSVARLQPQNNPIDDCVVVRPQLTRGALNPTELENHLALISITSTTIKPGVSREFCRCDVTIRFENGCAVARELRINVPRAADIDNGTTTTTTVSSTTTMPKTSILSNSTSSTIKSPSSTTSSGASATSTNNASTAASTMLVAGDSSSLSPLSSSSNATLGVDDAADSKNTLAIALGAGIGGGLFILMLIALLIYALVRVRKNRDGDTPTASASQRGDTELPTKNSTTAPSGEYGKFPPQASYGESQFSELN